MHGTNEGWEDMHAAARALSGTWVMAILAALSSGPLRFGELSARVQNGGAGGGRTLHDRSLTQTLTTMQRDGLVLRTEVGRSVPRVVTYELTGKARSLIAAMGAVRGWRN
ncbi:DNA-binding HxlR family transcriptional regulator [Crossiella equi]|uniref:DNA-binding HxlR family transcriptional regulator n=1 Tax=Crossiella equi TaxID=130796 RepID=A0ABS5A4J3_9PSEU|nr:helix-turn-helix domain-containing protein [Crossiella equi]MBP2471144.1 DNA-binding HxlR family transcriptional regulator [Crossiella equi]